MTLKKMLSVFLAAVMLMCTFSIGLTGLAATIDLNTQYNALADAMKNDYVRDLTNYTIQNKPLENGNDGFDTEANSFAYEHLILASDNTAGDILKAANIFYYIAESLISTTYGVGNYNPDELFKTMSTKLKTYFNNSDEDYYEDFYGNRYIPNEEELAAYNNAVAMITATGREVSQASLTSFNIYFMKQDYYSYYNVDTILKYFLGNTLKINTGNWYHRFAFAVKTDVDTCLKESDGINNLPGAKLTIRTAVYELNYKRTFDETGTKAYYSFDAPSKDKVYEDYASELKLRKPSDDLSQTAAGLTKTGQASALFINVKDDEETIPVLRAKYALFEPYIKQGVDPDTGAAWDARFAKLTDAQLAAVPNAVEIVDAMDELTATYSNEALLALFGKDMGNMVTLTYILKSISDMPERTVRGDAEYIADANKLNTIVRDMDALVYSDDPDSNDTAKRVGTIVSQFFNTNSSLFAGTDVEGMGYTDLNELVHHLVTGLLFRDSIVNMLVELIYPMIVDLLEEKLYAAIRDAVGDTITGWANDIIDNVIEKNDLAIYPNTLADRINSDYPGKFTEAAAVLKAAGSKWENVNFDAVHWGVDDAAYNLKADLFIDALCAGLGGFMRAVVTVMCGDAEYTENAGLKYDSDQFNEYFDKYLLSLGIAKGYLRSQGGYTKLIVPLFRVLGIPEMASGATYSTTISGYVTPADYHKIIASKDGNGKYRYNYSLRLILAPIIYWVENILAQRPFETIWDLIPNLVYFFTRQGSSPTPIETIRSNCTDDQVVDRTHGGIADGVPQYEQLQSYNLLDILDSIYVLIDIKVLILGFWKNFTVNVGSLADLIDKDEMLGSVNGLLNEVLKLEYVVGESGILNTVAYANAEGIAVMPDSYEYATNKDAYPIELQYVYANEDETEYRANSDDTHTKEITNPEMLKASYKIPALQEAKLTSVTTLDASGKMVDPNAIGVINTDWNTIDVRNPGVVLLYVLRFVISALGYRYDANIGIDTETADDDLPYLIECFGLKLDNELFQGLNLQDIIFNVMLHPDEAICALLELFYSNETGNYYNGDSYTYAPDEIDYHEDVLLNKAINPTLSYGTQVRYSQYWTREYATDTLANVGELVANILTMLDVGDFDDGFGPFLENLLNENVFNNKLMNTLFNTIYQLLGGLNDQVGFDIETLLDAALDVSYSTGTVSRTLEAMAGATPASTRIKNAANWLELFTAYTETDPVTGEEKAVISDVELDWGIDTAADRGEQFLKTASALLSPVAFVIRFLFMDEHLDILGLINIDAYAGYQYAFIGLLEALSCPGILTYEEYYEKGQDPVCGDANTIYYLLSPVLELLDAVYADPVTTILDLIPNLLFFISIGGLNDLLNNLVHFAYVLLDILKPIVNGYDLLGGLISNINISGLVLNLSLPLDLDFNALISDLLGTLVGDSLQINGVSITLPYIDFHTLCCGVLDDDFDSKEDRRTVRLDSSGGADLITAIFRLLFEVLFMEENKAAISQIITNAAGTDDAGNPKLDDFDKETMTAIVNMLFGLLEEYEVPDMLLYVVYFLVTKLTPISGTLKSRVAASGMSIKEVFSGDFKTIVTNVLSLVKEPTVYDDDEITIPEVVTSKSFWDRIKDFFLKIKLFFQKLFGKA